MEDNRVEAAPNGNPDEQHDLIVEAWNGDADEVRRLVNQGANPTAMEPDSRATPIHAAAIGGHVSVVRYLVNEAQVDVNMRDGHEQTPLHLACQRGQADVVRCLVNELRANIGFLGADGFTPLHIACIFGHFAIVRFLVEETRADFRFLHDASLLRWALATRDPQLEIIRYLIETVGMNISSQAQNVVTPLHVACRNRHMQVPILNYLLDNPEANLHEMDQWDARTLLDHGAEHLPEPCFLGLLTKVEAVSAEVFKQVCEHVCKRRFSWGTKLVLLEKYASLHSKSWDLIRFPFHTLLVFPLSTDFFLECCNTLCRPSLCSSLDNQGRLPIHIAIANLPMHITLRPDLVPYLAQCEPRSVFCRDLTTRLYPYEAAALATGQHGLQEHGLNTVYELFRVDPVRLLCARGLADEIVRQQVVLENAVRPHQENVASLLPIEMIDNGPERTPSCSDITPPVERPVGASFADISNDSRLGLDRKPAAKRELRKDCTSDNK